MLIYFITLIIVMLAVHMADTTRRSSIEYKAFLAIGFASMVLVPGLRDMSVGTDSWNYVEYFNNIHSFADVMSHCERFGEYGFWFLIWMVHSMSDQYLVFFIIIAMIVVGCYQRSIVRYSSNCTISFFVFITMGFYTFFFNGARQGIACAIYALAIGPLLERDLKKYIGYILLAFLFHKTALMMLPIYFIFTTANSPQKNILILIIGITGATFFQKVVEIGTQIDSRYGDYGNMSEGSGYLMIALTAVLAIFFFSFKKKVHTERERYTLFFNMFLFGAMISVVSALLNLNASGFLRFSLYFNIAVVFLWPIVFKNMAYNPMKRLFMVVFIFCHLTLYALTTERFSDLIPYTFNPAVSSLLPFGD